MQIKKLLQDKRGEIYLRACFLIMIISIVFVLVWSFCMTVVLATGQRKSAIQVLDKYTQYNAIDIHNSIKMMTDDTASLDASVYIDSLCLAQSLAEESGAYAAYNSGGGYRYAVSDVQMSFTEELTTKIQVSYILNIPFRFMGTTTWLEIPLTIYSRLDPKFFSEGETALASYTVRNWKQTLSGTYELAEQWTNYGTSGSTVKPPTANYPGFVSPAVKSIIITADRKKVVDYYYNRETYTVTITAGDGVDSVTGAGTYMFGENVTVSAILETGCYLPYWEGNPEWLTDRNALVHKFVASRDVELRVSTVSGAGTLHSLGYMANKTIAMKSTSSKSGPVVYKYYGAFAPTTEMREFITNHWNNLHLYFQYLFLSDMLFSLVDYEEGVWGDATPYIVLYYKSCSGNPALYALVIPKGAASIELQSSVTTTAPKPEVGYPVP